MNFCTAVESKYVMPVVREHFRGKTRFLQTIGKLAQGGTLTRQGIGVTYRAATAANVTFIPMGLL